VSDEFTSSPDGNGGKTVLLKEFGEFATKLSRNPLGILSLAFVLVYGIAVLAFTNSSLESTERLILVWFIVLFPPAILFTFYRLVTKHPEKLYAPTNFTDEENFLEYALRHIPKDLADERDKLSPNYSAMDYKILQTLWTHQVNHFPDRDQMWTFRLNYEMAEYIKWRIASSKLIGQGKIGEMPDGHVFLTRDGYEFCKSHYSEFPEEKWWPEIKIKKENLKRLLEGPNPS